MDEVSEAQSGRAIHQAPREPTTIRCPSLCSQAECHWQFRFQFPTCKALPTALPAQPGWASGATPALSVWATHRLPPSQSRDSDSVNLLCVEFLLPPSLGYPHIPNATPILLFAQTSRFVTWNDLLIVSFPLASFQGFVVNVKCCLKNVFRLVE